MTRKQRNNEYRRAAVIINADRSKMMCLSLSGAMRIGDKRMKREYPEFARMHPKETYRCRDWNIFEATSGARKYWLPGDFERGQSLRLTILAFCEVI